MELQIIQNRIFEIRGYRVMLDFHLAEMYQVETKVLKQAVKRNIRRFPPDFTFELTKQEYDFLRSQFVTLENNDTITDGRGKHSKYLPFAFSEQGVAMLSSVLRSNVAIEVNISIMRAFVRIRELTSGYSELRQQLDIFIQETNLQFNEIYLALTELAEQKQREEKPRPVVGYANYK